MFIITVVSSFLLRYEVHYHGDQRISSVINGDLAIDIETLAAEVLSEGAPEVGESVFCPLSCQVPDDYAALQRILQAFESTIFSWPQSA